MIDFIKLIHTTTNFDKFLENHKEKITTNFNYDTGEIVFPYNFRIEHYEIKIFENKPKKLHHIQITGSLHKNYFTGTNYQQFTYTNLINEIHNISTLLGIEASELKIQNLEIGVNIKTAFTPYSYLCNNLLLYKTNEFHKYYKGKDGKELGYFYNGFPNIKIYDKGKQNNLNYNLMRFELRYLKSKIPNKYGIYTLNDLKDITKLTELSKELVKAWQNVLLYEIDLIESNPILSKADCTFYRKYEFPKNWIKLLNNSSCRNLFYSTKKRFIGIIEKYGKNIHKVVQNLIENEIKECTIYQNL